MYIEKYIEDRQAVWGAGPISSGGTENKYSY